jgi:hypothetical protein
LDKRKLIKIGTPEELLVDMARKKNAGQNWVGRGGERRDGEGEEEEWGGRRSRRRGRRKERVKLGLGKCEVMLSKDRQLEGICSHQN